MCQTGYSGDPQIGCIDVNECVVNNPCAPTAVCHNIKGSFVCECPPNTTGEPYGAGCIGGGGPQAKQECTAHEDCDHYLACDHGSCVNPCDNLACGANAYCEPDKHAPWCRCVVGYTEGENNECISGESYYTTTL